jgi:hypothetical protein
MKTNKKITASLILCCVGLFAYFVLINYNKMVLRFSECDASILLFVLEENFKINFPDTLSDSHGAVTYAESIGFCLVFTGAKSDIQQFMGMFPDYGSEQYSLETDPRLKKTSLRYPAWFLKPIKFGVLNTAPSGGYEVTLNFVVADTEDPDRNTVYISGLMANNAKNRHALRKTPSGGRIGRFMRVGQVGFALSNVKSDGFGTGSVDPKDEFEAMFRPRRRLSRG